MRGNNNGFTAYVSTGGATWRLIGSTLVTTTSPLYWSVRYHEHASSRFRSEDHFQRT